MSDNELDAELLALAGDDSASEVRDSEPSAPKSPSPIRSADVEVTKARPARRTKTAAVTKTSARAARGGARRRKDDSEDDGEG